MMVAMQVVLPAPLRPSSPSSRPGLQREADAVQHMAVAVEGIDAADTQAPHSPRYTSLVRGSATTSARVPSTITSP